MSTHPMIETCRWLHQQGLLAAADGNLSLRNSDGTITITPSGRNKRLVQPGDLASLSLDGQIRQGTPSSESALHLKIYQTCPQAQAVVHAHPPTAIAWTLAHPEWQEIPTDSMSEVILSVGRIPIAPYCRPGGHDLANSIAPFLPTSRVIILARHGAVAWGENLEEALNGIERLEAVCQILLRAQQMGGWKDLPTDEVQGLWQLRKQLGDRTR